MHRLRRYVGISLMLVLGSGALAGTLPATRKFPPNAAVDALFARFDSTTSPGCVAAAARDGKLVYSRGYGMANLDHGVVNTPQTPFHVASVSKQFAAAAVALLSLDGRLSLDDDVRKYVPEVPELGGTITLRQLIHHTSGLRDQWELLRLAGWKRSLDLITDEDVLRLVSRQRKLNFPPNSRYRYSNTGYTLLGIVVKRVTGQSLREFTTERIFRPLGMNSTHFRDDHKEIVPGFANGYERAGDTFRTSVTNFDTTGATSLISTPEDLLRWDENFYTGQVGGRAFTELMVERGVLSDGTKLEYATGVEHEIYRGLAAVGHSGSDAGYRSKVLRFPGQHFGIAVTCNISGAWPDKLANGIADAFLAAELQPLTAAGNAASTRPLKPSVTALREKAGIYLDRVDGRSIRLVEKDGQLLGLDDDVAAEPLVALEGDRFRFGRDYPLVLEFTGTGARRQLTLEEAGEPARVLGWVPGFAPTVGELQEYAGLFTSDELDVRYRAFVEDGKLQVASLRLGPMPLTPLTKDVFGSELGTAIFSRDAADRIDGFSFTSDRALDNEFVKMPE